MTEAEWWDLWRRDPRATPFQSPAWAEACWRHLGGGERLDAELRDGDGLLVAALPLFVWRDGDVARAKPAASYREAERALMRLLEEARASA